MLLFKKIAFVFTILFLSLILAIKPTWASVQLDGQFKANKTCQAVQSIRMGGNPGNIHLVENKVYHVIAKDRKNESHYLIEMPEQNINPSVRWVAKNCGEFINKLRTQN